LEGAGCGRAAGYADVLHAERATHGSSEELLQLDSMKTVMEKVFSAHNGEWFQT